MEQAIGFSDDQGRTRQSLPSGWRLVSLECLCSLVNGNAFKTHDWGATGTPIIRIQNLNDATKPFNFWSGPLDGKVVVKPGDVLLAWSGTPGTSFGAHLWKGGPGVLNQHIFRADLQSDQVVKAWLVYAINHELENLIRLAHGGVGLRHVKKEEIQSLQIVLPPLPEQRRIVSILNEQLDAVDKAKTAAEARLEAAKALRTALMRSFFDSSESRNWPKLLLGEVGEVVAGVTLGRNLNHKQTRLVPYLRVANVKDGYLDLNDVKLTKATEDEIERLRLRSGDLLLTEGGDADKLGRGTFWAQQIPECIHQNHIFRVRLSEDTFLPEFVATQMSSAYGKAYFLKHAKQTTGIATINQKVLKAFPLMTPGLTDQETVIEGLSEKLSIAGRMRDLIEEELLSINALSASFLRTAFNGEL